MDLSVFRNRIKYKGDLKTLFAQVVKEFNLGTLKFYNIIRQGYEDLNVLIETEKNRYFVKIFADFRDNNEVRQYVDIMQKVVDSGIAHPKLFANSSGYLYKTTLDDSQIRLVVIEYVDGLDFYRLNEKPNEKEMLFITNQASKINTLSIKPRNVYDSWAIPNFLTEYEKVKKHLDKDDLKYILPLVETFTELNISNLPQCFVHGDIIATNTIRSKKGQIYIIDFAVANIYPRIQELAVLFCDLFFIPEKVTFLKLYDKVLREYLKTTKLENREIDFLPTYIKLAHAMHIIPATREKLKGTKLPENEFWLTSGQRGIRFVSQIWD